MINPTPKIRFIESGLRIANHRKMVESNDFVIGSDFALMQYQRQLAQNPSPSFNDAAANHFKLMGAQEFLACFKLLAEVPKEEPKILDHNLDHRT